MSVLFAVLLLSGCGSEPASSEAPVATQAAAVPPGAGGFPPPATPPGPAAPVDRSDVVLGLAKAPGRDDVLANCTACHSTALITQNRMTRERWDATITWMQQTQKLWDLAPDVRGRILDYLTAAQGVEGSALGEDSPWAEPMYRPNPIW